jgi:hypothetical protein
MCRFAEDVGLRCTISMLGYEISRDVSGSPYDGLALCITVRRRLREEVEVDEPVEHAEACHYPLLSANMPTRGKLYRKRNFRVVRAMDCKTSPAIAIGTAVLKFGTEFDYLSKVLISVLVLYGV